MVIQEDPGRLRVGLLALTVLLVAAMAGEALAPAVVAAERQRGRNSREAGVEAGRLAELEAFLEQERSRSGVNAEVVGGKPVAQGTFRFMTVFSIQVQGGSLRCGGSLIEARFVLTAAHCVEDSNGDLFDTEQFTLIVGRALLPDSGNGAVRGVVEVAQHPEWDPESGANDVAVLELDVAVPESIAKPLPLVGSGETRFDGAGQPVVVAGWGRTSSSGSGSDRLRSATLNVVGDAACDAAYEDFGGIIPAVMVCAAFKGRDSCQGDSGGPLFAREVIGFDVKKKKKKKGKKRKTVRVPIYLDVQMGIVSFGLGCAVPGFPGVYTRLSNAGINEFVVEAVGS